MNRANDMRVTVLIFMLVYAVGAGARAEQYHFKPITEPVSPAVTLTIYSTTDIDVARPLLTGFQNLYPHLAISYHDIQSIELYDRVLRESDTQKETADLVFSSAMDLQMKLANDGYAEPYQSETTNAIPTWAKWRNEAFGVTFEPAVIVYNKAFFKDRPIPKTRAGLEELLNKDNTDLFGRIATYDVQRSGFGLLVLARDLEHYTGIWNLVRAFGRNGVKLYTSTAAILDRVSQGKFVLGYNVLGSYAATRARLDSAIDIVLPSDYTVVLSRIAIIPRFAKSKAAGKLFLDFLLSRNGQQILADDAGLNAIHPKVQGPHTASAMRQANGQSLRPVKVGPGLLVYLDQVKRAKLLNKWEQSLSGR